MTDRVDKIMFNVVGGPRDKLVLVIIVIPLLASPFLLCSRSIICMCLRYLHSTVYCH